MTPDTATAGLPASRERSVRDRDSLLTAAVRAKVYKLYSILLASPHEFDVDGLLREDADWLGLRPYGIDLGALRRTFLDADMSARKRDYSGLFEVGDAGAPVAIREQQEYRDVAGILEDLTRFYDFFDYPLHTKYAWAPDHMSVILEFCHLLCHRESTAREDRLSFQLAQHDFVSRHLIAWSQVFADRVDKARPGTLYAGIAWSASAYVARDFAWQASTVSNEREGRS